jgi:phage gpG-like protein
MAGDTRVDVLGWDELAAGSRTLFAKIEDAAQDAFDDVARDVASRVSVPRKTGRLAGSVEAASEGGAALVRMGKGIPYAGFVEYGGRGHPHSPTGNYLYPVAMDATPLLVTAGTKAATDEIGGMRWPTPT